MWRLGLRLSCTVEWSQMWELEQVTFRSGHLGYLSVLAVAVFRDHMCTTNARGISRVCTRGISRVCTADTSCTPSISGFDTAGTVCTRGSVLLILRRAPSTRSDSPAGTPILSILSILSILGIRNVLDAPIVLEV